MEGYPKLSLKKYKPIAARNEDANVLIESRSRQLPILPNQISC